LWVAVMSSPMKLVVIACVLEIIVPFLGYAQFTLVLGVCDAHYESRLYALA